jgi:hypothetical protein
MKSTNKLTSRLLITLALTVPAAASNAGASYEGAGEFFVAADFDGDGNLDAAMVQKQSGDYRIGYADAAGWTIWTELRPSGMTEITGVSAGHFLSNSAEALALASPMENRIVIIPADDRTNPGVPQAVFSDTVGPELIASIALGNGYSDGLAMVSTQNGSPAYADGMFAFAPPAPTLEAEERYWLNRPYGPMDASFGGLPLYGILFDAPTATDFQLYNMTEFGAPELMSRLLLPIGSKVVKGEFVPGWNGPQFAIHHGNESEIRLTSLTPPTGLLAPTVWSLSGVPEQFVVIPDAQNGDRLFVIYEGGTDAELLTFDAQFRPVVRQQISLSLEEPMTGAIPLSDETLYVLTADPQSDGSTAAIIHTRWNGEVYAAIAQHRFSAAESLNHPVFSNVLVYRNEPFVSDSPELLERFQTGDWTINPDLGASDVAVLRSIFTDEAQGLGPVQVTYLGQRPAGSNYALGNQVRSYASIFNFEPIGPQIGSVGIVPAPGAYDRGMSLKLVAYGPGLSLHYRVNNGGPWTAVASGTEFGPFFEDVTIQYYARSSAGATTIKEATYLFNTAPEKQDADKDGVPDFVEDAHQLDPQAGPDSDGDGFTDLEEILSGTDPAQPCSQPLRPEDLAISGDDLDGDGRIDDDIDGDGFSNAIERRHCTDPDDPAVMPTAPILFEIDTGGAVDVAVRPVSHTGSAGHVFAPSLDHNDPYGPGRGTLITVHDIEGRPGNSAYTIDQQAGSLANPLARLNDIMPSAYVPLGLLATPGTFDLDIVDSDRGRGRGLVALAEIEPRDPPVPDYTYGSLGDHNAEVFFWMESAMIAYGTPRPLIEQEIDYRNTATALLVEKALERLLIEREVMAPSNSLTLTPFRPQETPVRLDDPGLQDGDAVVLDDEILSALEKPVELISQATHHGVILRDLIQRIQDDMANPPNTGTQTLLDLARDIYRISAAFANDNPGDYPPPITEIRAFLDDGRLTGDEDITAPASYQAATQLSASQIADAFAAVANLTLPGPQRRLLQWQLAVDASSFAGPCTILRDVTTSTAYSLVNAQGRRSAFAPEFDVPPGAIIEVTGYADLGQACAVDIIEVVQMSLAALPSPALVDADQNLLNDAYEMLVFGGTGNDPYGDPDGDGITTLQESLQGTDANDGRSAGSTPSAPPVPPVVFMYMPSSGVCELEFQFSPDFAGDFAFGLESTSSLTSPFEGAGLDAVHEGNGMHRLQVDQGEDVAFYRFRMRRR